jgi:hypothetical protein
MAWRKIYVMDREAYEERRAIMEVENPGMDLMRIVSVATEAGYKTALSKVLSAIANDEEEDVTRFFADYCKREGHAAALLYEYELREVVEEYKRQMDGVPTKGEISKRRQKY